MFSEVASGQRWPRSQTTDARHCECGLVELSSIRDTVSNKEGVVREQQEQVVTESMALEEALDKVRKAEYELERQQQKLEEKQQALEFLLGEQEGVNARMC